MSNDSKEMAKRAAARAAAEIVASGMTVGLGTGSTAAYLVERLAERCREGLKMKAVATSQKTYEMAKKAQMTLIDPDSIVQLDLTIDGADEIDPKKRMIKGGGGALLREKIVASMSQEMVVIVDSSKLVDALGTFPLPVEMIPFAYKATLRHLHDLGFEGTMRQQPDGTLYKTDGGHYIYDIRLPSPCSPEEDNRKIRNVPGVVETGFFLNLAKRVFVGYPDGKVKEV